MQRNVTQWLSIAKFLEADPLKALGLPGGWVPRSDLACDGREAVPGPELVTPPSNTGVNKVGDVAGVDRARPVKYSDLSAKQKLEIREILLTPPTVAGFREFINEDLKLEIAFLCGALIPMVYLSLLLDVLV